MHLGKENTTSSSFHRPVPQGNRGSVAFSSVTQKKEKADGDEELFSEKAEAPERFTEAAQRVKKKTEIHNYYKEVNANNPSDVNVDNLDRDDKTLRPITENSYNRTKKARVTDESGAVEFELEKSEKASYWSINTEILEWATPDTLRAKRTFALPVSCIESAEHIVEYSGSSPIPDWDESQSSSKSVEAEFNTNTKSKKRKSINISKTKLTKSNLRGISDFDFSAVPLGLNEGIILVNPSNPMETIHAVVVVGINNATKQIIVAERNAGETTGDNVYVDNNWLLNEYPSAAAFKASMGSSSLVMGKLLKA